MIEFPASAPNFTAQLEGVVPDALGDVFVRLVDSEGDDVVERTTDDVTEGENFGEPVYERVFDHPDGDGPWRVIWEYDDPDSVDPDDRLFTHEDVRTVPALVTWQPTVAEVGNLLRARTKNSSGNEDGVFNADTRPTGDQVESLIGQAVSFVYSRTGEVSELLEGRAGYLAALYTAMLVELSYFPEQIQEDHSPYEKLKELFDEGMAALLAVDISDEPGAKGLVSVRTRSDVLSELAP